MHWRVSVLLLVALLLSVPAFAAGDLPVRQQPTPETRASACVISLQSRAPQAQLIERPVAPACASKPSQSTAQQGGAHPQRPFFKRLNQLFEAPHAMKRLKRKQRNFMAGFVGFLGLCAGLVSNWYGLLLLIAPANYSAILVSGIVLGLMLLAGYLGIKSVNMANNAWGIAALVSAVVSLVLLVVFLIIVL